LLVSSSASGFQGVKQELGRGAKLSKTALYIHLCYPVTEKAGLEVIRGWFDVAHHERFEGFVRAEFIDRLSSFALRATADKCGVDELWDRWRRLSDYAKATSDKKVWDPLSLHDVLD
jgi:hypothetical protein